MLQKWTVRYFWPVSDGRIAREEACRLYQLSKEEFLAWEEAFNTYGYPGLRATQCQNYRRPPCDPGRW
jgi:hypothetical protein